MKHQKVTTTFIATGIIPKTDLKAGLIAVNTYMLNKAGCALNGVIKFLCVCMCLITYWVTFYHG